MGNANSTLYTVYKKNWSCQLDEFGEEKKSRFRLVLRVDESKIKYELMTSFFFFIEIYRRKSVNDRSVMKNWSWILLRDKSNDE